MIFPWNTNAPLYHFPVVTIALIVVNTAAFAASLAHEDPSPYMLEFGDGLHPVQWITSFFMHADPVHLVGNMIFLWGFGLVIEGKIGWWRFLLVYLGLGIFQAALVQLCMLSSTGAALGASGAIYGLLAMALIWAPQNEMSCVGLFGFRIFHFEVPILFFVGMYVMLEIYAAWRVDFQMSTPVLHLAGALPGFLLAAAMVKLEWVDCENYDLFAVLGGREGEAKVKKRKPDVKKIAEERQHREARLLAAETHFRQHLQNGRAGAALAIHQKMSAGNDGWQLERPQLLALIQGLHKQQLWSESIPPMVEYLRTAPDGAPRVRLKLAQILIVEAKRPGRALSVLEKIPAGSLTPEQEKTRRNLEHHARKAYANAELEVDGEDW